LCSVGQIGYLTDGDAGGTAIAQNLERNGVKRKRIVILRNSENTAVEVEDFIDPKLLLLAANRILGRFYSEAEPIVNADLTIARRMNSLEIAYRARTGVDLPKVELAYELLDLVDECPGQSLLDSRRRGAFGKIAAKVIELFKLETK
jgi:hypothetical protein